MAMIKPSTYLGLSLDQARLRAQEQGISLVVRQTDGAPTPGLNASAWEADRLLVCVSAGKVISANMG